MSSDERSVRIPTTSEEEISTGTRQRKTPHNVHSTPRIVEIEGGGNIGDKDNKKKKSKSTGVGNSVVDDGVSKVFCKVPDGGLYFWVIMAFCTPVGETLADTLVETLQLGLPVTTIISFTLLAVSLIVQFVMKKYFPPVYWWLDVVISACGTCMCDGLSDGLHVPTGVAAGIFFPFLLAAFGGWYYVEGSIDIHSIYTFRREVFYWAAVLSCFAFGTTMGDFISEVCKLGYGYSALVYLAWVLLMGGLWSSKRIPGWVGFWLVYLFNRPLGSNIADLITNIPDCEQFELPDGLPDSDIVAGCADVIALADSDTCDDLAASRNITIQILEYLNPNLNCSTVQPGDVLCGGIDGWTDITNGGDTCVGVVDKWHWGYGFNRVIMTFLFLSAITLLVGYLTYSKADVLTPDFEVQLHGDDSNSAKKSSVDPKPSSNKKKDQKTTSITDTFVQFLAPGEPNTTGQQGANVERDRRQREIRRLDRAARRSSEGFDD